MSMTANLHNPIKFTANHLDDVPNDSLHICDADGNHVAVFMHPKLAEAICEVFETLNSGECGECEDPFDIDDLEEDRHGKFWCASCVEAEGQRMEEAADEHGDHLCHLAR